MIRAIVTDIEGTTSAISFVRDVLFPYAAANLPAYVRAHADSAEVAAALDATAAAAGLPRADTEALIAQLLRWSAEDSKITPLKTLQGLVWRAGYTSGAYRAHIYPDAVRNLRAWQTRGLQLFVYSSGSVAAQQLFFAHSAAGDLRALFNGYFDTTTGPKQSADSYRAIAAAIDLPPAQLLFLSDVRAELDAARAVGFATCWLQRPDDGADGDGGEHPVAHSFDDVVIA